MPSAYRLFNIGWDGRNRSRDIHMYTYIQYTYIYICMHLCMNINGCSTKLLKENNECLSHISFSKNSAFYVIINIWAEKNNLLGREKCSHCQSKCRQLGDYFVDLGDFENIFADENFISSSRNIETLAALGNEVSENSLEVLATFLVRTFYPFAKAI